MNTQDFKRKLTAVFSADVAGYSRLMGEDEAATVKTLEAYKQVMFSLIKQHRGRVIDSPGDNLLAEFASVVDAVQCGVAVQNELKARNADLLENRRMHFRIGINLGDVIEEGERIYGDGVNIAARLESCADPGGICVSKTAFDHIETKLPLGYEYLGEKEVKNISKPVGAYRVLMEPRVTLAGANDGKRQASVWRRKPVLAGAIAVLIVLVGAAVWNFYWRAPKTEPASKEKMAFPLPDKPSIAVMPFLNMSSNPEYDSLADSLSENIIYTLSYLPGMFVIARNSTFSYKGKPVEIRQVAEQLGVRYVLEGSVLRAEDRVRVTAQLIDATTGYHLWSGRFDRTLKDIFSLLDEITKTIAGELQVKVSPDQWASLAHKTDNFDAWAATTKSYSLLTRGFRENVVEVKRLAEEGVLLDPKYGFGWAVLAAVHTLEVIYGLTKSPADSIKLATECNQKALILDPTLSCVTANRGQIYLLQGKVEEATAFCRKAIDMAPSLDMNYLIFGITMDFAGNFDEAIPLFKKAMRLNPFYPARYLGYYGMACLMAGRKEEALSAFKEYLERAQRGDYPVLSAHLGLSAVYAELGNEKEARTHSLEILKIDPNFSVEEAKKVHRWKDPKYSERFLSSLRKTGLPDKPALPLPDKPSIAVLPFVNMSDDKSQEYFSDGLTEEIITALSKTPKLFVIARNSTFVYKGKPVNVQQVSRELGVKYVLEGSVRRSGDQLRITAQLIDATTGNHLWAERYDRGMKDIFAIQDEITLKVTSTLNVNLTDGEFAFLLAKGTTNLEAYLKMIQAREVFTRGNREDNARAKKVIEEVIKMDPSYAMAYSFLAGCYYWDVILVATLSPGESVARGIEMAQKAVSLDQKIAFTHGTLAQFYHLKKDWDKAVSEAEIGVALEPNSASAYSLLGMVLIYSSRYEESIFAYEKSIRLDPFTSVNTLIGYGNALRMIGRYEEAATAFTKLIQWRPDNLLGHIGLAATYSMMGRQADAQEQAKEVLRINPAFSLEGFSKRTAYRNLDDWNRFMDALRKAGLK